MRFEDTGSGLRVQAPAKINIYLEVGRKRPDGFHDIDSLFQAVSLYDELEFTPAPAGEILLEESGIRAAEGNLVWRAADMLRRSDLCASSPPGVRVRLRKRIPQGGGLGGGSSDAAATLLALTKLWDLEASVPELLPLAARLGSDVPFFLIGGTARCRGRGEVVEPLGDHLGGSGPLAYVLVSPRLNMDTKRAYEELDRSRDPNFTLTKKSPLDSMADASVRCGPRGDDAFFFCQNLFFNRFEAVVYALYPRLRDLYHQLQTEAFLKVLLSGSGSTIFGLCKNGGEARQLQEKLSAKLEADVYAVESVAAWNSASL